MKGVTSIAAQNRRVIENLRMRIIKAQRGRSAYKLSTVIGINYRTLFNFLQTQCPERTDMDTITRLEAWLTEEAQELSALAQELMTPLAVEE